MKEKYLFLPPKPKFTNKIIDKKELKKLMAWAFSNYGTGRASYMADRLKELGFHYATKAGISLSVEDLRVPPTKRELLHKTNEEIKFTSAMFLIPSKLVPEPVKLLNSKSRYLIILFYLRSSQEMDPLIQS